jgi:hypothetical protein
MISMVSSWLSSTFSPVVANGALNLEIKIHKLFDKTAHHCSKVPQELKIEGSKKFNSAQSSGSLFCNGVPVSSRRC